MIRNLAAFVGLATVLLAQTITVPAGRATNEGNAGNSFPWGRGNSGLTHQCLYGAANFLGQGLGDPIRITRLEWRLDAGAANAFAGATYSAATVRLSTSALPYAQASATFLANRGPDVAVVHSGPVTLVAGSASPPGPGPAVLDLTLASPFTYWPRLGDLNVEVDLPPNTFQGALAQLDVQTTGSACSRVFNSANYGAANGTVQQDHGVVLEIGYQPATGLFAHFEASPTAGPSPLVVQFTDRSHSSAAGGVTGWAWDFDNDGVTDSTLQNPTRTFAACGTFSVSLRVTDGVHAPATRLRSNLVTTDVVVPSFTSALVAPGGVVQFTDTSSPTPTSWAWDLDGDQVVDSTLQHPTFAYGAACANPVAVTLTVNRLCRGPYSTQKPVRPAGTVETRRDGATLLTSGCYFDVSVGNPLGVSLCQLEMKTTAASGAPVTFDLFATPGTYVGKTTNPLLWRQIGTASTTGAPGVDDLELASFAAPVYLPAGFHGLYLRVAGGSPQGSTQTATSSFASPDLSLSTGASGTLGSPPTLNRVWNGAFHYTTCANNGDAGYGFFGAGCAGPLGVPGLRAANLPRLGQTATVLLEGLPFAAAFLVMGFDRTLSPFGPLPVDLAPFQAPACFLRIRPDAVLFLVGAGTTASWNLPIPNDPGLLCVQFFHQALVLSPASNGLGGVVSDAAAAIVGR